VSASVTVDNGRTRFIAVHYHIFKNGGTTIESVLRREFGPGFRTLHGAAGNAILSGEDLAEFLLENPTVTAVSSHHLRYPKPSIPGAIIFDCCFLRHPLDRLVSVYSYYRSIDSAEPLSRLARRFTQRDFIRQLMDESPHQVSNVQVTQLARSGAFCRPANEKDLEQAAEFFCDSSIAGLVDMFSESLVAAEYFLRPAFPGIRLDHIPQNVTRAARVYNPDRLRRLQEELVDEWGADLYEAIVRLNEFDLELYQRAQSEVLRRLFLVPGFQARVDDFRKRCGLPVVQEAVPARVRTKSGLVGMKPGDVTLRI